MFLRSLMVMLLSATVGSGSAIAGQLSRDFFDRLPPQLRGAAVKKLIAQQRVAQKSLALDTTAPRITALSVSQGFDAARQASSLKLDLVAVDDLSGLDEINITWQHQVTGRSQSSWLNGGHGRTQYREHGRLLTGWSYLGLPPGPWKMVEAYGWDIAGNAFHYDQEQLAALGGNISFEVRNHLYEETAPALVRGTILTTSVSRSSAAPGTADGLPLLTVDLTALEPKTTRLSGIAYANLELCKDEFAHCISLSGGTLQRNQTVTWKLGGRVQRTDDLGSYHIVSLTIYDTLQNSANYYSTRIGGDTDFSHYFPVTQVEITP